jgi:2'-5' RNA ligase
MPCSPEKTLQHASETRATADGRVLYTKRYPVRLFLAIELSDPVRDQIVRVADALREKLAAEPRGVSWTRPENLHVTMKFLGEVDSAHVKRLCDALASVPPPGEISLAAAKIQCLPQRGPLRIIAAGMSGDLTPLAELHRQIETSCAALGFREEGRRFLPHVTFTRVKQRLAMMPRQIEEFAEPLFPSAPMAVTAFVLMESDLKPSGAEYTRLARFPITAPA